MGIILRGRLGAKMNFVPVWVDKLMNNITVVSSRNKPIEHALWLINY